MFKLELLIFKISFIFLSSQIFRLSWLKPEAEVHRFLCLLYVTVNTFLVMSGSFNCVLPCTWQFGQDGGEDHPSSSDGNSARLFFLGSRGSNPMLT